MSYEQEQQHELSHFDLKRTEMIYLGKPILAGTHLENSPDISLLQNTVDSTDLAFFRAFLQVSAPVTVDTYILHAHLQTTEKVAMEIGKTLKKLNPAEFADLNVDLLQILALSHDIGRFITHRFYMNDLQGEQLLREVGMGLLTELLPPLETYLGKGPGTEASVRDVVNRFSIEQKIIEMADFCGKRDLENGSILTFETVMGNHRKSRANYQAYSGITEIFPQESVKDEHMIEFSGKVFTEIYRWFQGKNVDLEQVRKVILEEEYQAHIQGVLVDGGYIPTSRDMNRKTQNLFASIRHAGLNIAVLSNTVQVNEELIQEHEIHADIEETTFPSETRASTQEKASLWIASLRLRLPPQACLMISDNEDTLQNARAIGMKTLSGKNQPLESIVTEASLNKL